MLISELKSEIKKYKKEELEKIIVELYKRIPKSKKEDYDIDYFIKNIDSKKVEKKEVNFETLTKEISYFLGCVDNGLYRVPNRIISKKERSTWRFKVKRYYKELIKVLPDSENGGMATFLLIELFKRLSTGSNTLLFVNWDTFKALGVSQYNYYDIIMKRILYNGYTKDALKNCIDLLNVKKDPDELSYSMFEALFDNLKTSSTKEEALELLNDKIIELKKDLKNAKDFEKSFAISELLNNYVELVFNIYISLHENEKAIAFFQNNYNERDNEVKEYVLLCNLEDLNLIDEWIKEYEAKQSKINFRDSLKSKYENFKHH